MSLNKKPSDNQGSEALISDAELVIMQAVWQTTEPVTVQFVHEQLKGTEDWQYNTIATFMVRLVDKGFLDVCHKEGRGRTRVFTPLISEEEYLQKHLQKTINRQFRGSAKAFFAAYMSQEKLSKKEIDELRQWLDSQ